jgi:hypothetical protein
MKDRRVSQPFAVLAVPTQEGVDRTLLRAAVVEPVHLIAERTSIDELAGVPDDVFARRANADFGAVETIVIVKVRQQQLAHLLDAGRQQLLAGRQEMRNLAEDPGRPCAASS